METHKIAGNNMYMLRILPKITDNTTGRPALEVATENLEEILDWQRHIEDARNTIESLQNDLYKRDQVLKQQSRNKRIALEMSDLVIYCRPVPFQLESESLSLRFVLISIMCFPKFSLQTLRMVGTTKCLLLLRQGLRELSRISIRLAHSSVTATVK